MANRHVIEGVDQAQADFGFPDHQRMLLFVTTDEQSRLRPIVRAIRDTVSAANLDVGFIEFGREPEAHFANIRPLEFDDEYRLRVGEDIAVCGYPYGEAMLQKDGRVYRWGPVVQQGHLSAVSPYDAVPEGRLPSELLLDVRIAGGMSGSPIIRSADGRVVGIVHSAWESTTAVGVALTASVVAGWLERHPSSGPTQ